MNEEYRNAIRTFVAATTPIAEKKRITELLHRKTGYSLPAIGCKTVSTTVNNEIAHYVRTLARISSAKYKQLYEKYTHCRVVHKHDRYFYIHIRHNTLISPDAYNELCRNANCIIANSPKK